MSSNPRESCECSDPGCPVHEWGDCVNAERLVTLKRIDMGGEVRFCRQCAELAMDSGVFAFKHSN